MTPKEKAKKLVKKFNDIDSDAEMFDGFEMKLFYAQRCALIAVNEMLNDHLSNKTTKYGRERYHFWQKVKHEIEQL